MMMMIQIMGMMTSSSSGWTFTEQLLHHNSGYNILTTYYVPDTVLGALYLCYCLI